MTVKANWHARDLLVPDEEGDPFAEVPKVKVQGVGVQIDLDSDDATLEEALRDTLQRESRLYQRGVTCPIKDSPDTSCAVCPVAQDHSRESPLSPLCRLGKNQERILTMLAVRRHGERRE